MEREVVLCAASAYEQKFYFNPDFMGIIYMMRLGARLR